MGMVAELLKGTIAVWGFERGDLCSVYALDCFSGLVLEVLEIG